MNTHASEPAAHSAVPEKPAESTQGTRKHSAGAFGIRNVISILLGIYGAILVVCSFVLDPGVNPDAAVQKNSSDNLWTGVALLVVAAGFLAWARLRPIIVQEPAGEGDTPVAVSS